MIISDINYIKSTKEEVFGGCWIGCDHVHVDKDIKVEADFKFDVKVDIDIKKDVDIKVDVKSDVDLDDNYAQLTFDAEAIGKKTLVEADVFVLTTNNMSAVGGLITTATD
ncbi:MAG: hypothetical protein QNJ47_22525 [Nostocaceae cyanobacterium]|nr:hypothetical protein [Nostocaceae cyanobacterium]